MSADRQLHGSMDALCGWDRVLIISPWPFKLLQCLLNAALLVILFALRPARACKLLDKADTTARVSMSGAGRRNNRTVKVSKLLCSEDALVQESQPAISIPEFETTPQLCLFISSQHMVVNQDLRCASSDHCH